MYKHSYLRICSQNYDTRDIKNLLKHLTNYTLNKQNYEAGSNDDMSVCDVGTFNEILKQYFSKSHSKKTKKSKKSAPNYEIDVKP